MAFRILDSQGRRTGLPGHKSHIYTVSQYGASRISTLPIASTVYRTTTQNVAAGGWVNVVFQTCIGSPVLWDGASAMIVPESDWYTISAGVAFVAAGGPDTYQGFRVVTNSGLTLLANRSYVPSQYSYPFTEEITLYLNVGVAIWMDVTHTDTVTRQLREGIRNSSLSISRVGA
jgi:hypothetical protein